MAAKDITADRVRELFNYDPETGLLTRRMSRGSGRAGIVAGTSNGRYLQVCIDRAQLLAHRVAWLHYYGAMPTRHIDHIDRDGLNNRIANLRDVPPSGNAQNRRQSTRNTTGVTGVTFGQHGNMLYRACVNVGGRVVYQKRFRTLDEAATAVAAARAKFHPFAPIHAEQPARIRP